MTEQIQIPTFTGQEAAASLHFAHELLVGSTAMHSPAVGIEVNPQLLRIDLPSHNFNLTVRTWPSKHPVGTNPEKPATYAKVRDVRKLARIDLPSLGELAAFAGLFQDNFPLRRITVDAKQATILGAIPTNGVPLPLQSHLLTLTRRYRENPEQNLNTSLTIGALNVRFMPFVDSGGKTRILSFTHDHYDHLAKFDETPLL